MTQSSKHSSNKRTSATEQPDRGRMIAEAAYYLAEQRGFLGGDPVKDWLAAEVLIDQTVGNKRARSKKSK